MPHLEPESCHPPPSERVAKTMRSFVARKPAGLTPPSADLIPIRKPDGPPCRIVVNRDPFRHPRLRETFEFRALFHSY